MHKNLFQLRNLFSNAVLIINSHLHFLGQNIGSLYFVINDVNLVVVDETLPVVNGSQVYDHHKLQKFWSVMRDDEHFKRHFVVDNSLNFTFRNECIQILREWQSTSFHYVTQASSLQTIGANLIQTQIEYVNYSGVQSIIKFQ